LGLAFIGPQDGPQDSKNANFTDKATFLALNSRFSADEP